MLYLTRKEFREITDARMDEAYEEFFSNERDPEKLCGIFESLAEDLESEWDSERDDQSSLWVFEVNKIRVEKEAFELLLLCYRDLAERKK